MHPQADRENQIRFLSGVAMMDRLTERQKKILAFIESHTKEKGFPPTQREIGKAVGLKSPSTVFGHIERLEKQGYIRRVPGSSRAIEVVTERQSDEVKIVKWHKDVPSVIRWKGRRYVYDPNGR